MITVPKQDWLALCDAVSAQRSRQALGATSVPTAGVQAPESHGLSADKIERLLDAHYIEVLGSRQGRRRWRKLLAQASIAQAITPLGWS